MSLGENVRIRREQLGLTQDEVAERAGLRYTSQPWISAIERGEKTDVRLSSLQRLAKALECTVDDLLRET